MLIKVVSVVNLCDIDVAPINYVSSRAKDGNNFVSLALLIIDFWLVVFSSKCEDVQMIMVKGRPGKRVRSESLRSLYLRLHFLPIDCALIFKSCVCSQALC